MGWLAPIGWFLALGTFASLMSYVSSPAHVRRAVLYAMPQRQSLGGSRMLRRFPAARRLYETVWPMRHTLYRKGFLDLETFDPTVLQSSDLVMGEMLPRMVKRAMDIVLALAMGIFLLPLVVAIAVWVRLDSKGPSFYRQTRVGRHGREISVIKFRTMRTDAEKDGAQWAEEDDPRITRAGRFLRKTRLDEIPQVWPILTGEMSFVGPRPERPEFTSDLARQIPHFELRLLVKPGLTGWAQVSAPYSASVEDSRRKLSYDLYYLQHQSALLDWFVAIKTVRVALLGVGSR